MELKRKPFQGVLNIIHFNWHFYVIAGLALVSLFVVKQQLPSDIQSLAIWVTIPAILSISISLVISFYIYDISDLYQLSWLPASNNKMILNINAGFDETSEIIQSKYPECDLSICDFYHPKKHTEISILRARKAYPPPLNTIQVSTEKLPFPDSTFDIALAILSAHEIREKYERINFFKELNRVTKSTGQIYVTEHLRDLKNFMAYTLGFFHFHSKSNWLQTFELANLKVKQEIKITAFITTFILEKHGDTL